MLQQNPIDGVGDYGNAACAVLAQHRHGRVGLYTRLGIFETPIFTRMVEERRVERTPVLRRAAIEGELLGL